MGPATLAPYLPSGCLAPTIFERLTVVSEEATASLSKPGRMMTQAIATLEMQGDTSGSPANWSVANADAVRIRSPWLTLPVVQ
eukprot:7274436-Prymnesium_polylepis.2